MDGPDGGHDDVRALFGDYARGRLDDWRRGVVDQHLYWCLDCRTALRAILQPDGAQDGVAEPGEDRAASWWLRRMRWLRR